MRMWWIYVLESGMGSLVGRAVVVYSIFSRDWPLGVTLEVRLEAIYAFTSSIKKN